MSSLIVVSREFDSVWPFAGDHFHQLWKRQGPVTFVRLEPGDRRPLSEGAIGSGIDLGAFTRLSCLGATVTPACVDALSGLREIAFSSAPAADSPVAAKLSARSVEVYRELSQGHWGASVSEFALALTFAALRRIPQIYRQMLSSHDAWDFSPPGGVGTPGARGQQFGDDPRFVNGAIAGKRVHIAGMGNIGARYASVCAHLGADVVGWDPIASEPCFHRSGARRVMRLEELAADAEIVALMLPLTPKTRGLIPADFIRALPKGSLLVMVTRMEITDAATVRQRVLANELLLAADVFDVEPLPLDDPLLGHPNVVHTPHLAGRTIHSNQQYAESLAVQFRPR